MSDQCPNDDELMALAVRPPGDPALAHAESCPRCRSRLKTYREFLRAESDASPAEVSSARARLSEHIAQLAAGPRSEVRAARSFRLVDGLRALWAPSLRPLLVAATLVLVAAGAMLALRHGREPSTIMRGNAHERGLFDVAEALAVDGGIELSWDAVSGAEGYRVRLLAPDLTELKTLAPTSEPRIFIPTDALPRSPDPSGRLAFRVVALRRGAPLAASRVGSFRRR